jgi:hypothetical protein
VSIKTKASICNFSFLGGSNLTATLFQLIILKSASNKLLLLFYFSGNMLAPPNMAALYKNDFLSWL